MAGRKLFVGSLPPDITDEALRIEYGRFGRVEDVYIKQGCEPGRQWAFVTLASPEEAQRAKESTDLILQFAGCERPCDVKWAKNQGMFGQDPLGGHAQPPPQGYAQPYGQPMQPVAGYGVQQPYVVQPAPQAAAPAATQRKIFVGSLPDVISEADLRQEFSRFGQITDVHINNKPVETGRQWAFITFASGDQAQNAKSATDRLLVFPGCDKACEVTLARNQGLFGQAPAGQGAPVVVQPPVQGYGYAPAAPAPAFAGPRKIFAGSLPQNVTEAILSAEFGKYGQVVDIHLNNKPAEPGRNWAFITFATSEQATYAKDNTDRLLMLPGADRACEVMIAKNQGKFGQDPNGMGQAPPGMGQPQPGMGQPPPPLAPPPAHLTQWRQYKTVAGLPYYHNHSTGVTQWDCPPELQVPGQQSPYMHGGPARVIPHTRTSPY